MQGRHHRVLVVDDERFFREAIQETLSAAGLECLLAADGAEALEMAGEPSIGAVVLDVRLPGMDGLEVLRRLRGQRPDLPVIMLSAHQDQGYVLDALRQGASDYLAKPLHEEELVLAVRRALEAYAHAATSGRLRSRLEALQQGSARLMALARAGDAEALRAGLAEVAADVLGVEKTSLMLLDESGTTLRVVAATGHKPALEELEPVPVGEAVAGVALARSEPLRVADLAEDSRFAGRTTGDRYRTRTFAVAPVVAGDRALGVLCATDPTDGLPLGEEDLVLLRILAEQAAGLLAPHPHAAEGPRPGPGISGETLPLDAAGGAGDVEMARGVCEAVASEVEPLRVLSGALAAVGEGLGARSAALYLRDGSGALVCEAAWSADAEPGRGDRASLAAGGGLTGSVLEAGRPVVSDDPASDPRFDPQVDTPPSGEPAPMMCLPMRFRGKTLGVFRAFLAPPGRPSPGSAEVLTAALSAAVRNVLLYRSLVESIEEVARARRESRGAGGG